MSPLRSLRHTRPTVLLPGIAASVLLLAACGGGGAESAKVATLSTGDVTATTTADSLSVEDTEQAMLDYAACMRDNGVDMQDPTFDEHIPVLLTAMGPKTLELAGSIADGVILHTFFSDEALARCVATIRRGAEEAGRDPASVRIWSVLATVTDDIDEDLRLRKLAGRLATYCQAYGDLMVSVNGWDPADLDRLRADEVVASMTGAIDAVATTEQLAHIDTVIPDEWLAASATGSAADCAARVAGQLELGADSVILHGATPGELASVVEAYRAVRPVAVAAADLPANPGWIATPGS